MLIPPRAEQIRIVKRVNELMALCDRLETAQAERETRRDRVVAASLQRVKEPAVAAPVREDVQFQLSHLSRLTINVPQLRNLRQMIRGLAVRADLTNQDGCEEPATALLQRIAVTPGARDARRNRKSADELLKSDAVQLATPSGWVATSLDAISRRIHYGYTASANHAATAVRLLRITDIHDNGVDWESVPGCEISDDDLQAFKLEAGDILIARTGGTVGKTFLISDVPVAAVFASYLIRVQPSTEILDRYLKLFLDSPLYWKQLLAGARGTGQPNVNARTLGAIRLLLPPLAEQHRIVAKVNELIAVCDRLEAQIGSAATVSSRLLESLLHEALPTPSQSIAS